MGEEKAVKEFLQACNDVAQFISDKTKNDEGDMEKTIRLYSHYDADGLTAAGILSKAFSRASFIIHVSILSKLDDIRLDKIKKDLKSSEILVLSDLGSGKVERLTTEFEDIPIVIMDHHSTKQNELQPKPNLFHLNPHIFNIDGSTEISGAGVAYFVSKSLSNTNTDLACYAVIGALGDRQDKGENSRLYSLNSIILEDAVESGLLSVKRDFWIYGYQTKPLVSILMRNEFDIENVYRFLQESGIATTEGTKKRVLADLSEDEKKTLISKLVDECGVDPLQYFKPVYMLEQEEHGTMLRDAKEFSSLLNAAGRLEKPSIGVSLVMGDRRTAKAQAIDLNSEYKNLLKNHLDWATYNGKLTDYTVVSLLDARDVINERLIGTIISILTANRSNENRILVGVANSVDGFVKISARVARKIQPHIDVAAIMKKILKEGFIEEEDMDVEVGGHDAAAGAVFESKYLDDFIKVLDDESVIALRDKEIL